MPAKLFCSESEGFLAFSHSSICSCFFPCGNISKKIELQNIRVEDIVFDRHLRIIDYKKIDQFLFSCFRK